MWRFDRFRCSFDQVPVPEKSPDGKTARAGTKQIRVMTSYGMGRERRAAPCTRKSNNNARALAVILEDAPVPSRPNSRSKRAPVSQGASCSGAFRCSW
jgi:hypothetical protein